MCGVPQTATPVCERQSAACLASQRGSSLQRSDEGSDRGSMGRCGAGGRLAAGEAERS